MLCVCVHTISICPAGWRRRKGSIHHRGREPGGSLSAAEDPSPPLRSLCLSRELPCPQSPSEDLYTEIGMQQPVIAQLLWSPQTEAECVIYSTFDWGSHREAHEGSQQEHHQQCPSFHVAVYLYSCALQAKRTVRLLLIYILTVSLIVKLLWLHPILCLGNAQDVVDAFSLTSH